MSGILPDLRRRLPDRSGATDVRAREEPDEDEEDEEEDSGKDDDDEDDTDEGYSV